MKRELSIHVLVAAGVAFAAACGGDSEPMGPGSTGDELTASEAAALNEVLVALALDELDFGNFAPATSTAPGAGISASSVPVSVDLSVDTSAPCPMGGTVAMAGSITGTVDDETLAGDLDLDVSTILTDCGVSADGKSFTVNTSPSLTLSGSFAWDQTGLLGVASFTYTGGIAWLNGDRSGSCSYDVELSISQSGAAAASGTVCGLSLET